MFKGKALYQPQGRSGEYARWAINFYNGCTGGCDYCYNRRFPLLSASKPTLRACFKNQTDALETAKREIAAHKKEIIRDGGLFMSFVSDPCLSETFPLTQDVILFCSAAMQSALAEQNDTVSGEAVPVMVLTKRADWVHSDHFRTLDKILHTAWTRDIAFGFTLTGHDEMESGCSSNMSRISAIKILHSKGYRTWASIEPIIDFRSSLRMVHACAPFCNHFKIGIRTDKKFFCTAEEAADFVNSVRETVNENGSTVYFKRSLRDIVGGGHITGENSVSENFNF